MTDQQLETIGVIADKSNLHPDRYWCNVTQQSINVSGNMTLQDVVSKIFEQGYAQGIEVRKAQRSQEFKNLINNVQ